mgnify:FL=1
MEIQDNITGIGFDKLTGESAVEFEKSHLFYLFMVWEELEEERLVNRRSKNENDN